MNSVRLNILLALGLFAAMLFSLAAGKVWVAPSTWWSDDLAGLIIMELRIPRTILGAAIGAGLGMAGAAMQGYLRNPLADPGVFGVSSSAALGAVTSLYFGFAMTAWLLPAFALAGAGIGMGLLALLAGRSGSLILFTLAGVIIASLASSLTTLIISLAPTPFATTEIVTWLMGALTDRSWDDVKLALPLIATGMVFLMATGRSLDALTLGEDAARSMGVNVLRLQWLAVIGVGLTVGASVAAAGIIGFVGLIVPHLVRPFAGHRPSAVMLPSALAGALLIVVADSLVRILPSVSELRLGIAMALLGAPFFMILLFKMHRELA
ncbi:iron complex transport system permease protein [Parasphingorhabdus marina DSM 22363]|uniref:Iron complex transport system permease protein n=1 Tax=Parasphingorhabdus marina DSM 22363 TaxID=1123272 RepID=A0A1N6D0P4_9SPHN|nr:iron ABC transporter permease [Parasphingorhabdus marina]SIN64362.1 iron complex transport system permease protein [Parasphingorhabdus marina DSM 22363]